MYEEEVESLNTVKKFQQVRKFQQAFQVRKSKLKKNHPKTKSTGSYGFTGEFYQIFRRDLRPLFIKFFQNI